MVGVVDAQSKPRVLELLQKSLTVTIHDTKYVCGELGSPCFVSLRNNVACRWIPGTAKFVALGEYARNTGCLQAGPTGAYVFMTASTRSTGYTAVTCRCLSCKTTSFTRSRRLRSQHVSSVAPLVLAVCLRDNWLLAAFKGNYRSAA